MKSNITMVKPSRRLEAEIGHEYGCWHSAMHLREYVVDRIGRGSRLSERMEIEHSSDSVKDYLRVIRRFIQPKPHRMLVF